MTPTDAEATLKEAIRDLENARQSLDNTSQYQDDSNFSNLLGSFAKIVREIKDSIEDFQPQEPTA